MLLLKHVVLLQIGFLFVYNELQHLKNDVLYPDVWHLLHKALELKMKHKDVVVSLQLKLI